MCRFEQRQEALYDALRSLDRSGSGLVLRTDVHRILKRELGITRHAQPSEEADKDERKKEDAKAGDVKKSDVKKSDVKKSDVKNSDVKKGDVNKSDVKKGDTKEEAKESVTTAAITAAAPFAENSVRESDVTLVLRAFDDDWRGLIDYRDLCASLALPYLALL
jgi:Ca2+-binding EF-hand superfamily protein